ncbi:MAG: threonine--tRNA ligase [Candidatus Eisenbacteria bacterium]|nr:threonine--tRNA ligase [Candidatus Eisenbacteria bacterium]
MRILLIHADRFSYHVTEKTSAVSSLADLPEEQRGGELGESLVAFLCSEKNDEKGLESVASQAAGTIRDHARQVEAPDVMLYPYAHLSSDLASPRVATKVLARVGEILSDEDAFRVREAPFGFYKGFSIECKGHPLSELAKTIVPGGEEKEADEAESAAIESEKKLHSDWRVATPDGGDSTAEEFDFSGHPGFRAMYDYEREGSRTSTEPPAHIELMRRLELVDYEPASDPGNFRWYPNGELVKRLIEERVSEHLSEYGAMRVETPIMYDYQHPNLMSYLNRFPARQYVLLSDKKEYFLRFAACFGQYLMQHDMQLSYRMLPAKLFEISHYSFRREQSGELAGLRRLRTFTMPDLHTLARDTVSAREEFLRQMDLSMACVDDFGLDYEIAVRFVRGFLDEDPDFAKEIVRRAGRPVLLEIWDDRFFYFVAKLEFNFVDAQKKASCLSTVQIDVENTERFEITYVDEDGQTKNPILMHTSISGSIERVVSSILEQQAVRIANGETPSLPFWLSPIQVRVIPGADRHREFCENLIAKIPARVDLDDRDMSMGKKIREAERRWVPYILVVGDREVEGGELSVRAHGGEQEKLTLEGLVRMLEPKMQDKPYRPINVPVRLSERPIFVG